MHHRSGEPSDQGLHRPSSPVSKNKRKKPKNKKSSNNGHRTPDKENADHGEEWNGLDDLDGDDDDNNGDEEEEQEEKPRKKKKTSSQVKKHKPADGDLIEDPSQISPMRSVVLEPLSKTLRQPAQERVFKDLSCINERIASLVQVKQMGLSTPENKKQLKQLMADRKKKSYELKRLQSKQKASNKYRVKQKKIVMTHFLAVFVQSLILFFRLRTYSRRNRNYNHNCRNSTGAVLVVHEWRNNVRICCRSSKTLLKSVVRAMIDDNQKPSVLV